MSPLDELGRHHLEAFQRAKVKGFPGAKGDSFDERLAVRLSWMRTKCFDVFLHLCQADEQCAAVAIARKWAFNRGDDPQLGWGNRLAVAGSIVKARASLPDGKPNPASQALLGCLKAALDRYAPENLDLLEPSQ